MHRTHGCQVIRLKSVYHVRDELLYVNTLGKNPMLVSVMAKLCEIDMWLSKPTHTVWWATLYLSEKRISSGKPTNCFFFLNQEMCVGAQIAYVVCANVSTKLSVSWNPYLCN